MKTLLIILLLSISLSAEYECKEPAPVWEMKSFQYQTEIDAYFMWLELYVIAFEHYENCMTKYHAPMRIENLKDI